MAERMAEYIGWKDPIGDGLYNMGVTDERIVRCRDCKYAAVDHSDHEYRDPLFCMLHDTDVRPENFCSWGVIRRKEQA